MKQFYDEQYIGRNMELSLYFAYAGGPLTGFRWVYDKNGNTRIFCKIDDKIHHHFQNIEQNDILISSRMTRTLIAEPGPVPGNFIADLREEACILDAKTISYILKYITIFNNCLVKPD